MYEAWDKYMLATMHPEAHEIAVLELAPDIVIRGDLHLLEHIFKAIHNHSKIDDWYVRGQVRRFTWCAERKHAENILRRYSWIMHTS